MKQINIPSNYAEELVKNAYEEWLNSYAHGIQELFMMEEHNKLMDYIIQLETQIKSYGKAAEEIKDLNKDPI
jgi:hypothetical protein